MTDSISKLASALAKAQSQIVPPKKTRKVDFVNKKGNRTKYNYADLAAVLDAIREPLSSNELSLTNILCLDLNGNYGLKTILFHSSGEQIDCWYPLPNPSKVDIHAQEFGSALTYGRRYSVSSLVGIASEEDDDGEQAANVEVEEHTYTMVPGPDSDYQKIRDQAIADQSKVDASDDLDAALAKKPINLLHETVKRKNIKPEEMPGIIKLAVGLEKRSNALTDSEIHQVIQFINLRK